MTCHLGNVKYSVFRGMFKDYKCNSLFSALLLIQLYCFSADAAAVNRGKTESEVDVLTDLLMQSMEASADPGFYGKSSSMSSLISLRRIYFTSSA